MLAVGPSSTLPLIIRISLAPPSDNLTGREAKCNAAGAGTGDVPIASWRVLEYRGALENSLGHVSAIAIADSDDSRRYHPVSNRRAETNLPENAFATEDKVPAEVRNVLSKTINTKYARGFRAVLATGDPKGTTDDAHNAGAGLCMLEHGLGLEPTVEGYTGLPAGAMLFVQPLITGGFEGTRHRARNDCSVAHGAGDRLEQDCAHGGYVFLFSDRVRSRTHVMASSTGRAIAPVAGIKVGF